MKQIQRLLGLEIIVNEGMSQLICPKPHSFLHFRSTDLPASLLCRCPLPHNGLAHPKLVKLETDVRASVYVDQLFCT